MPLKWVPGLDIIVFLLLPLVLQANFSLRTQTCRRCVQSKLLNVAVWILWQGLSCTIFQAFLLRHLFFLLENWIAVASAGDAKKRGLCSTVLS